MSEISMPQSLQDLIDHCRAGGDFPVAYYQYEQLKRTPAVPGSMLSIIDLYKVLGVKIRIVSKEELESDDEIVVGCSIPPGITGDEIEQDCEGESCTNRIVRSQDHPHKARFLCEDCFNKELAEYNAQNKEA